MPPLVGIEASSTPRLRSQPFETARRRFAPSGEPQSRSIEILTLRPTQITVGRREVEEKRRRYRAAVASGDQPPPRGQIPVVLGPYAVFALDRHHWLCALVAEGVSTVGVDIVDDLSHLNQVAFWRTLDGRGWCHPHGVDGRRLSYAEIPASVADLQDDLFRSLAGALRRKGGFAKNKALFSEFLWADYLRGHIDPLLVAQDFDRALAAALELARRRVPASQMAASGGRSASQVQVV